MGSHTTFLDGGCGSINTPMFSKPVYKLCMILEFDKLILKLMQEPTAKLSRRNR